MKNPAIPNHRNVVLSDALNASAPKGCVAGAFAWYFFCFAVLSEVTYASALTNEVKTLNTKMNAAQYLDLKLLLMFSILLV